MYSVMDYWYITTRSLCSIFWEMPTTNIFDKSELILCVNRGWKPQQSMMDMLCRMLRLFPPPLKHCDWASMIGVSVLIKGHSRIESTLTKQDFIQWYTCTTVIKINNGISTIMDTTINGTTLNENALKNRSTDVCMSLWFSTGIKR